MMASKLISWLSDAGGDRPKHFDVTFKFDRKGAVVLLTLSLAACGRVTRIVQCNNLCE
jgi:hypothetical protein